MRTLSTTTPLEYTHEFTQNPTHSALSFSIGVWEGESIIRQLFPFCWCRDVLVARANIEAPRLDPSLRYVLLIRDISFGKQYIKTLKNTIYGAFSSSLLQNAECLSAPPLEFLEESKYIAAHVPVSWIKFPYILSHFALWLRVVSMNYSGHPFKKFAKLAAQAGLNDPMLWNTVYAHEEWFGVFTPAFYNNIKYDLWRQSTYSNYGPLSFLKTINSYKVYRAERDDVFNTKFLVQDVIPLLRQITAQETKSATSKSKK